ncbi:hypothetical protein [Methylobacterium sp. ID0610]|uniref:hypothetical protein n=1 Tax=Methylobacterium carpenticola TaxID=3344827 RepID=UPI0036C96932
MGKFWMICVVAAAASAALVGAPGQAAQPIGDSREDVRVDFDRSAAQIATDKPATHEQPARMVRVVYPSPFSGQRPTLGSIRP